MREKLLDPTGASERAVEVTLAPRLRSLRGLTASHILSVISPFYLDIFLSLF